LDEAEVPYEYSNNVNYTQGEESCNGIDQDDKEAEQETEEELDSVDEELKSDDTSDIPQQASNDKSDPQDSESNARD
jgi:hypothetical protein